MTKQVIITNVLGEEEEENNIVCTYRNCYHTYGLHGQKNHKEKCQCHHFTNKALGVNKE